MSLMIGGLLAAALTQAYAEPMRPQFHFTAKSGWLNDSNGLVYFKGEYHLFFQHNPFGTQWGNMTWGHAVSKDLVHWTQLSEAIAPDALGTIFSGSAVVDAGNTAGFGKNALVCMYTAAGGTNDASKGKPFTQCLAYSLDGRSFSKYAGNPVLPHQAAENRDPKVMWYEPTKSWVVALYLDGNRYALFGSPDLKNWNELSTVDMPEASECPDFFALPLDGDRQKMQWVFWGASGVYRVGSFDGKKFTPQTESIRSNYGNTSYAAQTYFNEPKGRRIQIGWFRGSDFTATAWNQQMGFPTELKLKSTPKGPRLTFQPVDEISSLHLRQIKGEQGWYPVESGLMDIHGSYPIPPSGILTLTVNGQKIIFDAATRTLEAVGQKTSIGSDLSVLDLRILVDRASIEIYAQGGQINMPLFALPKPGERGLRVALPETPSSLKVSVFELRSIWNKALPGSPQSPARPIYLPESPRQDRMASDASTATSDGPRRAAR